MAEEIRERAARGRPTASTVLRRGCASCTTSRCRRSSNANFDRPLDLVRPLGPALELMRLGGLRRLGRTIGVGSTTSDCSRLFSFQALYAGLAPYEALALYAVITYMDT